MISFLKRTIAVPAVLVFAAACASAPPIPSANLQAAQLSISNAERVGAATHASAELAEARDKMSAANHAVDEKKMVTAGQLADQARAEAELAAARSDAVKADLVNKDMKRSTETLIEEMQRKTGGSR